MPPQVDPIPANQTTGESFALLLKAIAKFSDVEARTKDIFKSNQFVDLVHN